MWKTWVGTRTRAPYIQEPPTRSFSGDSAMDRGVGELPPPGGSSQSRTGLEAEILRGLSAED